MSVLMNLMDDLVMVKMRQQVVLDVILVIEEVKELREENMFVGWLFRDLVWEVVERLYMEFVIMNLNIIIRFYNLMVLELVKKLYFLLEREFNSCFVDVVLQVVEEIKVRVIVLVKLMVEYNFFGSGKLLYRGGFKGIFGMGEQSWVWECNELRYGFKEFWKDLFKKDKQFVRLLIKIILFYVSCCDDSEEGEIWLYRVRVLSWE